MSKLRQKFESNQTVMLDGKHKVKIVRQTSNYLYTTVTSNGLHEWDVMTRRLTTIDRLDDLVVGDTIAFGFNYNGGKPKEIIVDKITSIRNRQALVHFLYGHHSLAEYIDYDDIIAIGNHQANDKIIGWSGTFEIIKPDHPLLKELHK